MIDFIVKYLPIALQVVGACAVIATLTPTKVDDKIIQKILDVLNFLAGNIGKATNADSK